MEEMNHIPDPFKFYKQYSTMSEDSWAKILEKNLATDFFAETMGKQLEGYLNFIDVIKKNTKTYLETLPFPTEQDIHRLAGQIIALEDKIDFLEEGIDSLQEKLETILACLSELTHVKTSKQHSKRKSDAERSE